MRENRFAVWNKKEKSMEYLGLLALCDFLSAFSDEYIKETFVFRQSTGLHDKNGKEIYEKDILRGNQGNFIVDFENGRYTVKFPSGSTVQNLCTFLASNNEKEIIGNVFEDKELLNDSK